MNNIITGLEGQLQSAQYGTGPDGDEWYTAPPTSSMDANTLQWALERLIEQKADISQVVANSTTIFQQSTRINGLAMISIFDQRIKEYEAALLKISQPVPTPMPVPGPVQTKPVPLPYERPEPDPGQVQDPQQPVEPKKINWLLYLGIAAGGYLLLKKNKRVTGMSNETVAVVGVAALFLLSRKKQTEPEATVPAAIVPENIVEQSRYLR